MYIEGDLYRKILQTLPIPTVDIVFLNSKNQILLGKRNNEPLQGVHYIPGGRVEKGEKSTDAAKRKAKEELGFDIDTSRLRFLGVYDDIFDNSAFEGISTHCIPVTYSYQLNENEEEKILIGDDQHSDLRFFSIDYPSLHDMVKVRLTNLKEKSI